MAGEIAFDIFARDHASAVFNKVGASVEKSGSRFAKYAKTAAIAGAVVGAALVKFGVSSVKAFEEADASQRKLEDAYKRFPAIADVSIASMRKQSKAIEAKTKFDDDAVVAAQANLAMYKLTGTQIQKLTPLLVDYAARTGKDLPAASADLGKALLGQGRALKGVGIDFKNTKTTAGNFDELMTGLRANLGGFATTEGATASGRVTELKNKFNDLQENVGSYLVPALDKLTTAGLKTASWMEKNPTLSKAIIVGLVGMTAAMVALTAATAAWDAATSANPFVALALGVIAVGAAAVYAYNKFALFKRAVNDVGDVIKVWAKANLVIFQGVINGIRLLVTAFFRLLLAPILTVFGAILHAAVLAFGWIPGLKGPLHKAQDAFNDFKNKVNAIINSIDPLKPPKPPRLSTKEFAADVARYKALFNTITGLSGVNYVTTVFTNKGGPSQFRAAGGPVAPGNVYTVGERGPELFMPNQSGTIIPHNRTRTLTATTSGGSGGGDTYIGEVHVHGVQSTSQLWQELQKYAKRNGSLKLSGVTAS